jgi:hypothetical protein
MPETDRIEVFTENLREHPVVRAWLALGPDQPFPERIEMLRRRKKSVVYRVPGVGSDGTDVIAKKCWIASAVVERTVYGVLSTLPSESLLYYGFVEDADQVYGWVFVEDAAGVPYDPKDASHRRLGARWLATLHTSTQDRDLRLPERDAAYYLEHLQGARTHVRPFLSDRTVDAGNRRTLERSLRICDEIESRWTSVEEAFETMPRTLVHNDFTKFNVRVRGTGSGSELLPFDWEVAGWGLPTVDVIYADLDEYWRHVQPHWGSSVDRGALERALWIGMLLRGGVAALHWECTKMHPEWMEWPMQNVQLYLDRITQAQQRLDWCA